MPVPIVALWPVANHFFLPNTDSDTWASGILCLQTSAGSLAFLINAPLKAAYVNVTTQRDLSDSCLNSFFAALETLVASGSTAQLPALAFKAVNNINGLGSIKVPFTWHHIFAYTQYSPGPIPAFWALSVALEQL